MSPQLKAIQRYSTPLHSIILHHKPDSTEIVMQVFPPHLTTKTLPQTRFLLHQLYPPVLTTRCFNENNFSFLEEVVDTELGHLLEHLILAHLCAPDSGCKKKTYNGITKWNWRQEDRGVFHIEIDADPTEKEALYAAIKNSLVILDQVINSSQAHIQTPRKRAYKQRQQVNTA